MTTQKQKNVDISLADNITESDILKMPDDDYMNDVQLAFFTKMLLDLENNILNNAKNFTQNFQDQDVVYVADVSDQASNEEANYLNLKARNREAKLLRKIRQALNLIESGEYGYCQDTGEKIGIRRLLTRPTAILTTEAQERREKLQRHYAED
jgi:DnaK suppressor protein